MNVKIKLIITLAGLFFCNAFGADMENVYINGFFSQGYLKSSANSFAGTDSEDGTWEFNEAAISVKALLSDNLSAGIQIMSHDFGAAGNNKVNVDWAFMDYRANDSMGIRIGKFKKPEGLYNTIRDADAVRTPIILPQGIYSNRTRDIQIAIQGVSVYGFIDTDSAGSLDYEVFLGNQPIDKDDEYINNALLGGSFGINDGDLEFKYSYGIRLFWNTPVDGLRFGQSYGSSGMEINGINERYPWYSSTIEDGEFKIKYRSVSSFEYQKDKFTVNGEFFKTEMEIPDGPIGGPITPFGFPAGGLYEVSQKSYYLQFSYSFSEKFEMGTYYSKDLSETSNSIGSDSDPDRHLDDWVISAKYSVNDWWMLKAEIHQFDGWLGHGPDESGKLEDDWSLIALKSSISF